MSLRIHSISSLSDLATLRKRKQSDNPTTARQTAKAVCRRGLSAAKADLKQNAIRGKRKAIMGCLVKRSQFLRGRNLGLKNAPYCRPPAHSEHGWCSVRTRGGIIDTSTSGQGRVWSLVVLSCRSSDGESGGCAYVDCARSLCSRMRVISDLRLAAPLPARSTGPVLPPWDDCHVVGLSPALSLHTPARR